MEPHTSNKPDAPRTQWWLLLVFTLIGAVVGTAYGVISNGTVKIGATIGACIAGGIAAFEVGYVHHVRGRWLRRLPLAVFIVISMLVWVTIMTFSLQVIPHLMTDSLGDRYGADDGFVFDKIFQADLFFSVAIGMIMTAIMRLRSLVGGRLLFEFLTGRYRRPVDERRIFLFLDLCESTPITETLGSTGYHAFLRDFIEALERPIARHGGEIYQYVGDEVVATWPVRDPKANSRVIQCHFAMEAAIRQRSGDFMKRHGHVPRFRTGIHCGDVVAGEIGERRRQIVFVGDVVNTTARVEDKAREMGVGLLVSDVLLGLSELSPGLNARSIGQIQLKGKSESMELFNITRENESASATK